MRARRVWPFPVALLAFVALLGALPHFRFSWLVGEPTYFISAYDEPAYALWAFVGGGPFLPHRWLSSAVLVALSKVGNGSWGVALVLADLAFPLLCALLAWRISGHLTRRRVLRLALSLGLIFAQELFSFGCWTIWQFRDPLGMPSPGAPLYDLRYVRSQLPAWVTTLWPDYASPFLTLFRTPEPQMSLIFLYGILAILIEFCGEQPAPRRWRTLMALGVIVNLALVATYFFVATAIVVLEWMFCLALLAGRRRAPVVWTGALALVGVVSMLVGVLAFHRGTAAQGYSFFSRLPVVTPASIVAVLGISILVAQLVRSREWNGLLPLAAACYGCVLVLTNQQLVSGRMISTQHWERFVDYPLTYMGAALTGAWILRRTAVRIEALHAFAGAALVAACTVLVQAQNRVFEEEFLVANLKALAMKRAVEAVEARGLRQLDLLLEDSELGLDLQARLERRVSHLLDVAVVFGHPTDMLENSDGRWGRRSPFKREVFEYFARRTRTPAGMERILRSEVDAGGGTFVRFLFDPRDFWTTFSDGRAARLADIRALLPGIREDFEGYLETGDPCWSRPVVVLTRQGAADRVSERWDETLLVEATVGRDRDRPIMNMHAYLQTLSARNAAGPGAAAPGDCASELASAR